MYITDTVMAIGGIDHFTLLGVMELGAIMILSFTIHSFIDLITTVGTTGVIGIILGHGTQDGVGTIGMVMDLTIHTMAMGIMAGEL